MSSFGGEMMAIADIMKRLHRPLDEPCYTVAGWFGTTDAPLAHYEASGMTPLDAIAALCAKLAAAGIELPDTSDLSGS